MPNVILAGKSTELSNRKYNRIKSNLDRLSNTPVFSQWQSEFKSLNRCLLTQNTKNKFSIPKDTLKLYKSLSDDIINTVIHGVKGSDTIADTVTTPPIPESV